MMQEKVQLLSEFADGNIDIAQIYTSNYETVPKKLLLQKLSELGADGVTERSKSKGGIGVIRSEVAGTPRILSDFLGEWPEIVKIAKKLNLGERLVKEDRLWIDELAGATGWNREAVVDELKNITADPSERAKKYKELHEEYLRDAKTLKEKGDTKQAGEKLWGAVTALIKFYATIKGVPVVQWSRGKLDKFITSNVEPEHKKLFRDLLDKAEVFHVHHFYEAELDDKTFEERWRETIELLEKARDLIIQGLSEF